MSSLPRRASTAPLLRSYSADSSHRIVIQSHFKEEWRALASSLAERTCPCPAQEPSRQISSFSAVSSYPRPPLSNNLFSSQMPSLPSSLHLHWVTVAATMNRFVGGSVDGNYVITFGNYVIAFKSGHFGLVRGTGWCWMLFWSEKWSYSNKNLIDRYNFWFDLRKYRCSLANDQFQKTYPRIHTKITKFMSPGSHDVFDINAISYSSNLWSHLGGDH